VKRHIPSLPPVPKAKRARGGASEWVLKDAHVGVPTGTGGGIDSANVIEAIEVPVPQDLVGMLIGRKGEGVKYLQAQSGAAVRIDKTVPPVDGKAVVQIYGEQGAQARAKELIEEFVAACGGVNPIEQSKLAILKAKADAQRERDEVKAKRDQEVKDAKTVTVEVPDRFVGVLIGKGGSVIKHVMEVLGVASAQVSDESHNNAHHLVLKAFDTNTLDVAARTFEMMILEQYRRFGIFNAVLEKKYGTILDVNGPVLDSLLNQTPPNTPHAANSFVMPPPPPTSQPEALAEHSAALSAWAKLYVQNPACVAFYQCLKHEAAEGFQLQHVV